MSKSWTFLSNHGAALLYIYENPAARITDVARAIDVSERAATRIVHELRDGDVVRSMRIGRRNAYSVNVRASLRRRAHSALDVADLLRGLSDDATSSKRRHLPRSARC